MSAIPRPSGDQSASSSTDQKSKALAQGVWHLLQGISETPLLGVPITYYQDTVRHVVSTARASRKASREYELAVNNLISISQESGPGKVYDELTEVILALSNL